MFSRSCRTRADHRSDYSSSDQGPPPSCLISSPPPLSRTPSFRLRRRFHLSFLRYRISSFIRLLRNLAFSCRHALQALLLHPRRKPKKRKSRPPPSNAGSVALAFSAHCTRSACTPDAIADCIEFIKKSSASSVCSSTSSFLSSQPSSPSRSSAFSSNSRVSQDCSPSLSFRFLSVPADHSDHQLPAPSHVNFSMGSQGCPFYNNNNYDTSKV